MTIERICKQCGIVFLADSWRVKKGWGIYCSRECASRARIGKPNKKNGHVAQKICRYCGRTFSIQRHRVMRENRGKFCSVDCFHSWKKENHRVELICKTCGNSFSVERHMASWRKYCSMRCSHNCPTRRERIRAGMRRAHQNGVYDAQPERLSDAWRNGSYDGVFQSPTSIERQIDVALDIFALDHTSQYRPPGFNRVYDQLVVPNILIEVHGDYWHNLEHKQQADEEKAEWADENGYQLVVIWEHEIEQYSAWTLVAKKILPLTR